MSSLELEQEIQIQLDSNPLLEKVEEQSSIESLSSVQEQEQDKKDLTNELNADHLPDDLRSIPTGMMSIPINRPVWAQQNLKSEKIIAKVTWA